jgi:hypothetical protein
VGPELARCVFSTLHQVSVALQYAFVLPPCATSWPDRSIRASRRGSDCMQRQVVLRIRKPWFCCLATPFNRLKAVLFLTFALMVFYAQVIYPWTCP